MTRNGKYISAAAQISIQEPLCDEWMHVPHAVSGKMAKAAEPGYGDFISPMEARRMSGIMKRALATSLTCMRESGTDIPDAIITGTGLGCVSHSEAVLNSLLNEGEGCVKPTHFMQSTHNTIGSLIGIKTGNHGYNVTYSHLGISFESALADACTLMESGKAGSALVGSHDEMTPECFSLLEKTGFAEGLKVPAGEASASFMLTVRKEEAICELGGTVLLYRPDMAALRDGLAKLLGDNGLCTGDIGFVMEGMNGNARNDRIYTDCLPELLPGIPHMGCKHLFGESFSASAMTFYCAVACFRHGFVPRTLVQSPFHMMDARGENSGEEKVDFENILIFNHSNGKEFSFTLLRSC